jgi:hypothetical protein
VRSDPRDVVGAIELSRATYRKMIQNLVWATAYNIVAIPCRGRPFRPLGIRSPDECGGDRDEPFHHHRRRQRPVASRPYVATGRPSPVTLRQQVAMVTSFSEYPLMATCCSSVLGTESVTTARRVPASGSGSPCVFGDYLTADAWKYALLIASEVDRSAATIPFCSRSRGIRLATDATGAR